MSIVSFGQITTKNVKEPLPISKRTIPYEVNRSINASLIETFETGTDLPLGWETSFDSPWLIDDDGSTTNNRIYFDMWNYASDEEGTLTTPLLTITAGDATLTFDVEYYLISGAYGNSGELYIAVSNDNGGNWTESTTNIIAGTAGNAAFQHTIDFTSFEGNDYTDENVLVRLRAVSDYGSYNIGLDNFAGPEILTITDDAAIISINTVKTTTAGNIDITGTLRNMGNQVDLASFDIVYTIDGGTASAIHSFTGQTIAPGSSLDFTHNVQYDATLGEHTIEVTISNPNGNEDENSSNNVMSEALLIVNEIFTKTVVYEEGTGTWCGWCVRGLVGLNTMAEDVTDGTWIGIGVHNADPMVVSAYDSGIGAFITGYPSGVMDRHPGAVDPGLSTLELNYDIRKLEIPVAKVAIKSSTWDPTSREMSVVVESTFALDMASANYNAAVIVVENNVTGTGDGWEQSNYYSGGSNGDMIDTDGYNYGSASAANPRPASEMVYNHVGRALLGGWSGEAGSIPASVVYNTGYSHTYSHTLPADQKYDDIHFVGIVIDNATGKIINATEVSVHDIGTTGIKHVDNANFNIFPNPTNSLINIETIEGSQIIVYNMLGKAIYNNKNSSRTTTIDLSSYNSGNYIVKVINNNNVSTQKVVMMK